MHKAVNWSLVAQRTVCSSTQFAGDKPLSAAYVDLFDICRPGECNYSLLTDYEHNVNGQFVQRGQRLSDDGETWTDLPHA